MTLTPWLFVFVHAWRNKAKTSSAILPIFRGPFITAMGKTWCPGCFLCSMDKCQRSLQEVGFVEEKSKNYFKIFWSMRLLSCEKLTLTYVFIIVMNLVWQKTWTSICRAWLTIINFKCQQTIFIFFIFWQWAPIFTS